MGNLTFALALVLALGLAIGAGVIIVWGITAQNNEAS